MPLGAPDHLHDLPDGEHRTAAERAEGRRAAKKSLLRGGVMVLVGLAALFVPVRLVAILGAVVGFLGLLVVLVAGMQYAVMRGGGGGVDEAEDHEEE